MSFLRFAGGPAEAITRFADSKPEVVVALNRNVASWRSVGCSRGMLLEKRYEVEPPRWESQLCTAPTTAEEFSLRSIQGGLA